MSCAGGDRNVQTWETFYLMIGTSAAALIGIMFVVITLTAEITTDQVNRGTVIYHNPPSFISAWWWR